MSVLIEVLSYIGLVAAGIMLLIITLRSLIDVGLATKIFPKSISKRVRKEKEEEIKFILEEIGCMTRRSEYKSLTTILNIPDTAFSSNFTDYGKKIVLSSVFKRDTLVGKDIETPMQYFVNVREHCLIKAYSEKCSRLMSSFLKNELRKYPVDFDAIITHRNGSIFIGYELSNLIQKPFLLVSEKTHIRVASGNSEILMEGLDILDGKGIKTAIFIDDSTTDGYMCIECVNKARTLGIEIKHAFVLFERLEGNGRSTLSRIGVSLHSLIKVNDEIIQNELK